jgi:hypothetical protein
MESENTKEVYTNVIADPIASDKLSTKLLQLTTKCRNFI